MDWSWLPSWLGGGLKREPGIQTVIPPAAFTPTNYKVTEETAMQISAVWAAVQLKSTTLASLGLSFYQMSGNQRTLDADHHLARLFRTKPNRYQTRMEFFETVGLNLYLTGNAYVVKQRLGGEIVGLLPLMSAQMQPELLRDGSIVYTYREGVNVTAYAEESIWHIKLFGNGIMGLSPLQYARNSIGVAIAGEDWASKTVGNGGKPTGVLTYDRVLTPDQRTMLREKFSELREGTSDALVVLEAGMQYQQVSLSPQDVQLLEARRFQVEDIARFFNVPSVLINDTAGSTVWGSGIEQIITGWYKLQFRSELERFEDSIKANLLPPAEYRQGTVDCEFNFEELLRTDFKTRVETGVSAVSNGLMTRNEWRQREWMAPVDGADELTVQVNLSPLDALAQATGVNNRPPVVEDEPEAEERNITVNAYIAPPNLSIHSPITVSMPEQKHHYEMAPQEFKFNVTQPDVAVNVNPTPVEVKANVNVDTDGVISAIERSGGDVTRAVNMGSEAIRAEARNVKDAVDGVKSEVAKPTRAVFDKDGNPIGSQKVDRLG